MLLIYDFLSLVFGSIGILAGHPKELAVTLVMALVFAGLSWYGAANYSKLWNLQFRTTATHAILCFVAAILTFVFVVLFVSFKYTQEAAEFSIEAWGRVAVKDDVFLKSVAQRGYEEVKKLGIEDFSKPTLHGGYPIENPQSKKKNAEVFASSTIEYFIHKHPFLSKIVWTKETVPQHTVARIVVSVIQFFESNVDKLLPPETEVQFAVDELKPLLREGAIRVVPIARGIIVALFLLVQLLPFGLIGWAAWRDLKVTV